MVNFSNNVARRQLSGITNIQKEIDDIAYDILNYMDSLYHIGGDFVVPDILLNNHKPSSVYGNIPLSDVMNRLHDIADRNSESQGELISRIKDLNKVEDENSLFDAIGYLVTKILDNPEEFKNELPIARQVAPLLNKLQIRMATTGQFYPSSNQIVLYYNNIYPFFNEEEDLSLFFVELSFTLAHELFHAVHYYITPKTFMGRGIHAKVVKEASAEFFAYLYLIHFGTELHIQVAEYKFSFWKYLFLSAFPYSKALYYMRLYGKTWLEKQGQQACSTYRSYEDYGSVDKLIEVLNLSKVDMNRAYYALVYDEDKYSFNGVWDRTSTPPNRIISFSITHYPGTFDINRTPIRYSFNCVKKQIREGHFKKNTNNTRMAYYVEFYADKHLMHEFLEVVNSIDWDKNYFVHAMDAGTWKVQLGYADGSRRVVRGCIDKPAGGYQLTAIAEEMYKEADCPNPPYIF